MGKYWKYSYKFTENETNSVMFYKNLLFINNNGVFISKNMSDGNFKIKIYDPYNDFQNNVVNNIQSNLQKYNNLSTIKIPFIINENMPDGSMILHLIENSDRTIVWDDNSLSYKNKAENDLTSRLLNGQKHFYFKKTSDNTWTYTYKFI